MEEQIVKISVEDFAMLAVTLSKIIECAVVSGDDDHSLSFMADVAIVRRSLLEDVDTTFFKIMQDNEEIGNQINAFIDTANGEKQ